MRFRLSPGRNWWRGQEPNLILDKHLGYKVSVFSWRHLFMFSEHSNEVAHIVESTIVAYFSHCVVGVGKHLAGMAYAQSVKIFDIGAIGLALEEVRECGI